MPTMYTITQAKAHLSAILSTLEETGEPVTIMRGNIPIADLKPHKAQKRKGVKLGFLKNDIWLAEDWDAPLPEDMQRALHMID